MKLPMKEQFIKKYKIIKWMDDTNTFIMRRYNTFYIYNPHFDKENFHTDFIFIVGSWDFNNYVSPSCSDMSVLNSGRLLKEIKGKTNYLKYLLEN